MNNQHVDPHEPTVWVRSSFSGNNGNCVEVAALTDLRAVRDSKVANSPRLVFSPASWDRFARTVTS